MHLEFWFYFLENIISKIIFIQFSLENHKLIFLISFT